MRDCNAGDYRRGRVNHPKLLINLSAWHDLSACGAVRPFVGSPHHYTIPHKNKAKSRSELYRGLGARAVHAAGAYLVHFAKKYGCKNENTKTQKGQFVISALFFIAILQRSFSQNGYK
jgi:hypothetical protein